MDHSLTIMPVGGRGCGSRKQGGTYMCLGTSEEGVPWHEFLLDPAVPWQGDRFLGVQPAPPELTAGLPTGAAVFVDMVGAEHYPTVPSYVEEIRRFGRSRYVAETFDWSRCAGKEVYVADVHWRAVALWQDTEKLPSLDFWPCGRHTPEHYPDCVYHLWPLALKVHELSESGQAVEAPWGRWLPLGVVEPAARATLHPAAVSNHYPALAWGPGCFAVWPVTHVEAVGYVPEGCNVAESGLDVVVVEE